MNRPADECSSSRRFGRWAAARFPRSTDLAIRVGTGIWRLFLVLVVITLIGFAFMTLGGIIEWMAKQGLTGQALLGMTLGFLILLFEWVSSWPGYVWLGLLALFLVVRIEAQLTDINNRLLVLDRRAIKLGRAVRVLRGLRHDNYDEYDE